MNGLAFNSLARPSNGDSNSLVAGGTVSNAAFVIDPWAGTLQEANAEARTLLCVPQGAALPFAIDSAMPALRRLREMANRQEQSAEEELQLWCGGRIVRLTAMISKEAMNDARPRMVVRALSAGRSAPELEKASSEPQLAADDGNAEALSPNAEAEPGLAADPAAPRDDRETLREIARRIREGHKTSIPAAVTAQSAVQTPSVSPPADCPAPAEPGTPAQNASETQEGTPLPPRQPTAAPDSRTLSKVAHELKTPLSAIVAAAEIMRDEQLGPMGNPRYLGYAGDIFESARHALDVINAMLTGTAREQRSVEPVDLNAIAVATVSVMQPLARSSSVNLQADCGDETLYVTGDATAIRQIIYNLVSNALKFTPQGGEVHVVTGFLPDGIPFLVVRDTGEGMDEDGIVQAFYRDEADLHERTGGGYGIGLPLVRRLAEMMQAAIDVDSEPGKGTVVLVSFPNR